MMSDACQTAHIVSPVSGPIAVRGQSSSRWRRVSNRPLICFKQGELMMATLHPLADNLRVDHGPRRKKARWLTSRLFLPALLQKEAERN